MRFLFKAPANHVLYFGPDDDPVLAVHGGEEYDHPEGFGVPIQSEPVDEEAKDAVGQVPVEPEPEPPEQTWNQTTDPAPSFTKTNYSTGAGE